MIGNKYPYQTSARLMYGCQPQYLSLSRTALKEFSSSTLNSGIFWRQLTNESLYISIKSKIQYADWKHLKLFCCLKSTLESFSIVG